MKARKALTSLPTELPQMIPQKVPQILPHSNEGPVNTPTNTPAISRKLGGFGPFRIWIKCMNLIQRKAYLFSHKSFKIFTHLLIHATTELIFCKTSKHFDFV